MAKYASGETPMVGDVVELRMDSPSMFWDTRGWKSKWTVTGVEEQGTVLVNSRPDIIHGYWLRLVSRLSQDDKDASGMYVSEKKPADATALVAELRTQLQQACKTADRIADLIGEQRPSVHEASN